MSLTDNRRLYDVATRVQVFVECVKLDQQAKLNAVLGQLSLQIIALLANVKFATLDGLSKAQLNALLSGLNRIQYTVYSAYTQGLIDELKAFMSGDLQVNQQVYATTYNEYDDSETDILSPQQSRDFLAAYNGPKPLYGVSAATGNDDSMWSAIKNAPIPANGIMLPAFVQQFSTYAQTNVINAVRKAYANNQPKQELIDDLTEETKQGTAGLIQRLSLNGGAMIATAMQHVASITALAVSSILYEKYGWFSVMDTHTTAICISRNGKVYRTAEGPLPPAHVGCRSHTAPIVGNSVSDLPSETFYQWAQQQPKVVQDDISPANVPNYKAKTPLSVAGFTGKVATILTR